MIVGKNTLPELVDPEQFVEIFSNFVAQSTEKALFRPRISKRWLNDARLAWIDDLSRVAHHEPNIDGELDHFKQCGHLAYWLRRSAPVIEFDDLVEIYGEEGGLYDDEIKARKLLIDYGTEYFAFDFGFQICQFYEQNRTDRTTPLEMPNVDMEYLLTVCNFLKFKQVSPHSIFLIYKSLLL
jgi:hypothetical protein